MSWTTTLNKIDAHAPCEEGWAKLLSFLGKTEADDEPLHILPILEAVGVKFAIWALRAVEGHAKEIARLAIAYAGRGLSVFEEESPGDMCARNALEASKRLLDGEISLKDLRAARDYACRGAAHAAICAIDAAQAIADKTLDAGADSYIAADRAAGAADYTVVAAARVARSARSSRSAYAAERAAQGELLKKMVSGELR